MKDVPCNLGCGPVKSHHTLEEEAPPGVEAGRQEAFDSSALVATDGTGHTRHSAPEQSLERYSMAE